MLEAIDSAVVAPLVTHLLEKADKMPAMQISLHVLRKPESGIEVGVVFDASLESLVTSVEFEGFDVLDESGTAKPAYTKPIIIKATGTVDHVTDIGYKKLIAKVRPTEKQFKLVARGQEPEILTIRVTTDRDTLTARAPL